MNKEIQKTINDFYKEYGHNRIKKVNNRCAKKKTRCPYTKGGNCRGYCQI